LESANLSRYEISTFDRHGLASRHNLKYWTRQPYFGFGVDAHSMLQASGWARADWERASFNHPERAQDTESRRFAGAVRFSTADSLEGYLGNQPLKRTVVSEQSALEEAFFLGLRLRGGVNQRHIATEFGQEAALGLHETITELVQAGMLSLEKTVIRLTPRGRLLSNEVFEKFIQVEHGRNDRPLHRGSWIQEEGPQ